MMAFFIFLGLVFEGMFECIKKVVLFPIRIFKKKPKKSPKSVSEVRQIIKCRNCSANLRVPQNCGLIDVTCPICKKKFRYDTGKKNDHFSPAAAKPSSTSHRTENVQKQEPTTPYRAQEDSKDTYTQTGTRVISITRLTHEYKNLSRIGITNAIKDARKVRIFLDGIEQGLLDKDKPIVLKIDGGQHTIGRTARAKGAVLPAGNDSFAGFYFNGEFKFGLVHDTFRDSLTQFVVNMVRKRGFQERILDPNNLNHAVEVSICRDCIWIHWTPAQTKGFKEWATGEKSEKLYYNKIGLIPTEERRQPGGYWEYMESYVHEAILSDEQADLQRGSGGFTIRTNHKLY